MRNESLDFAWKSRLLRFVSFFFSYGLIDINVYVAVEKQGSCVEVGLCLVYLWNLQAGFVLIRKF